LAKVVLVALDSALRGQELILQFLTSMSLTRLQGVVRIAVEPWFLIEGTDMSLVKIIVITVLIILSILLFGRFLF